LVLGVPFSHGIALLSKSSPELVPWAWAINAAGTVIGAVLAAIASMELGFSNVLLAGAACYVVALWAQQGLNRKLT
jgi:ABC-type Mn2+/Zn2+ transport system permease subunit